MSWQTTNAVVRVAAAAVAAIQLTCPAWAGPTGVARDARAAERARHAEFRTDRERHGHHHGRDDLQLKVLGRTYGEWAARWVGWAYAGPVGANAVTDTTGEFCAANQPRGPVWFLAGTFGGAAERNCEIPRGRALFYPIVETAWIDCPGTPDETLTDDEVRRVLVDLSAAPLELESTLDGAPIVTLEVPIVRAQTPVFRDVLPDNNVLDAQSTCGTPLGGGKTGRRLADGYWVMLPPLPPGEHTLTLRGAFSGSPPFETTVQYNLTVR